MRKIYYKEGEHINNKQEYILNFLPTKNNFFPPTFYKIAVLYNVEVWQEEALMIYFGY